ncbi:hypothetical protein ACSCBZ_41470 [Streptomyces niveiscabiei]|uniref:hypothetical protein n=1 Tax=Streptomyces niveiscabiei TaxID=164115 RepID=UPI001F0A06E6|nr:hypothetical protein [Streptomyces niveiscabiei]
MASSRPVRRRNAKLWTVGAGVVAALTVGGLALTALTGSNQPTQSPSSAPVVIAPSSGGTRVQDNGGVPAGYSRTEAGAKAAASNYATVSGSSSFLTDKAVRHRAIRGMTSARTAAAAIAESGRSADPSLKHRAVARTGVLAAHVLGFDIHKATVRLWTTTVRGSAVGGTAPQLAFRSVTVGLVWERGDWKVSGSTSGPGLVAPVDVQQTVSVAGDFADYIAGEAVDPLVSGAVGADGFPAPYPRTAAGSRAAATSAVQLYGDPRFFTNTSWRHRMLAATASPDTLASVRADADSTARLVVDNRGLGADGKTSDGSALVTRTAVLGVRPVSYSEQAASVEVWTASVGGIAGDDETQRPRIAFLRMTVDLVWSGGSWRTTAVTPGEPLVPSFSATEAASAAERFAEVGGVGDAPATA